MIRKTCFITKYKYGKNIVDLDEYVVSLGTSCSLKCEYCYLKFSKTLHQPIIYENLDKFKEELLSLFIQNIQKVFYFNCGETTDSLLTKKHFETILNVSSIISDLSKKHKKFSYLELRTKTKNIFNYSQKINFDNLKIIYTVSLSPQIIIEAFENGTASLEERIDTLYFAQEHGYLIGIRFEPIIIYPIDGINYTDVVKAVEELINQYKQIINQVLQRVDSRFVHSITLSCLRLTKQQFKSLLETKSKLCFFDMYLCSDGKYRYSRPIRTNIYNAIVEHIKNLNYKLYDRILLSFEFEYIWKAINIETKKLTELNYNC